MHKKKNTSPKIYVQIRKMLLLGIVIALGLSLGVSSPAPRRWPQTPLS